MKGKTEAQRRDTGKIPVDDEIFLQPWFLPVETYVEIRKIVPHTHLFKMRYYYEDWGCLRCGRSESSYVANGLCRSCSGLIRGRIITSIRRRLRQAGLPADYRPTQTLTDFIASKKKMT